MNGRPTTPFMRIAFVASALLALGLLVAAVSPASAESEKRALVLASSVYGGESSAEAIRATALGFTVDVVGDEAWGAMTAGDFAAYQLIVVGDPSCNHLPPVVSQNATALADAVMARAGGNERTGNRVLIGTDPVFHYTQGGNKLVDAAIEFAGVQDGATGLYLDFSCNDPDWDDDGVRDGQDELLPLLTIATSNWTQNSGPPCGGSVSQISNAAQFSTLASDDLQGWDCSVHETFPTFPTDWTPLAVATDTETSPTCGTDVSSGEPACGEAYVLIAGSGIVAESPDLGLSPGTATNVVGSDHTITATVTNPDESPRAGVRVSFVVTGANDGASGECVPAGCESDETGNVRFTYTGAKVGEDTINASITVQGSTQTATAASTWREPGEDDGPPQEEPPPTKPTLPPPSPPPPPALTIDDVGAPEGGTVSFSVRLSETGANEVSVDYATANGTATAPHDYAAASGTLTFAPGEGAKSVTIATATDTLDEANETFVVVLSNPRNATVAHGTGTATIGDDDAPPSVSVSDVTVPEGDSGSVTATFTLALSAQSGQPLTVEYTTADGSAEAGRDYSAAAGSVTFAAGETTKTVLVAITPNGTDELDRSFFLRVGGSSVVVADGEGVATIEDDDEPAPPEPGETGNLDAVRGEVCARLPGSDKCVDISDLTEVPIGTTVDATKGTAALTMSDGTGGTYTGEFSQGVFVIESQSLGAVRTLSGKGKPKAKKQRKILFTTLRLGGGDFGVCSTRRLAGSAKEKPKPKTVRRLWGNSKGKFRTKGRHSAATIRGTRWLTSDRCDGTLTYVAHGGPVSVLDFRLGRTIELRQGQKYLARPRGRR